MNRLFDSILYRWKRYQLGIWSPFREMPEGQVRIAGEIQNLHFPPGEEEVQGHEFHLIFLEDCYRLRDLVPPVKTVVDIGGNIGLFSLAALQAFQPEAIHTYEPNPRIHPVLRQNLQRSVFTVFGEAVGATEGTLSLRLQENSLHSTLNSSGLATQETVEVPQISLQQVLERAGGAIDLLKLDCEGAEWALLSVDDYWEQIRYLTMEYHLWAKPDETVESLTSRLQQLGFRIFGESHHADSFGLLHAVRE